MIGAASSSDAPGDFVVTRLRRLRDERSHHGRGARASMLGGCSFAWNSLDAPDAFAGCNRHTPTNTHITIAFVVQAYGETTTASKVMQLPPSRG